MTYQLEILQKLDRIHDVFHVSMLRQYRSDLTHVVLIKEIEVHPDLSFDEELVQIFYCEVKVLRKKRIPLVNVLWQNHGFIEVTWEIEDVMQQ